MSAGIALSGKKVVLFYYSTFSQRAYDQILNDIARQNLSVIIAVDRAGVVGEDGVTHQGIYDIAMFSSMPNMTIAMPKDAAELMQIFNYAFEHVGPIAIRYPRKKIMVDLEQIDATSKIECSWEILRTGHHKCVLSYGPDVLRICQLAEQHSCDVGIVNARFIKPLDEQCLNYIVEHYEEIIVVEQVVTPGSLYYSILNDMQQKHRNVKVRYLSFDPDLPIKHGKIQDVLDHYGFSDEDILNLIQ